MDEDKNSQFLHLGPERIVLRRERYFAAGKSCRQRRASAPETEKNLSPDRVETLELPSGFFQFSLVIRRETWNNPDFIVSAWTEEGEIMGVRHRSWPLHGVQFHPESFLTIEGPRLLKNFLEMHV